jgi:hypothetical protein
MPEQAKGESIEELFTREDYGSGESIADSMKHLSDTKKKEILTELGDKDINILTRMIALSDTVPVFKTVADNFMLLRISKKRASRKEITEVLKSQIIQEMNNLKKQNEIKQSLGI